MRSGSVQPHKSRCQAHPETRPQSSFTNNGSTNELSLATQDATPALATKCDNPTISQIEARPPAMRQRLFNFERLRGIAQDSVILAFCMYGNQVPETTKQGGPKDHTMVCLSYERTTVFVSPELRTGLGIYKYHRLVIQLSGGPDPEGRRVRIKNLL
jgi:hypothetical protein